MRFFPLVISTSYCGCGLSGSVKEFGYVNRLSMGKWIRKIHNPSGLAMELRFFSTSLLLLSGHIGQCPSEYKCFFLWKSPAECTENLHFAPRPLTFHFLFERHSLPAFQVNFFRNYKLLLRVWCFIWAKGHKQWMICRKSYFVRKRVKRCAAVFLPEPKVVLRRRFLLICGFRPQEVNTGYGYDQHGLKQQPTTTRGVCQRKATVSTTNTRESFQ